MHGSDILHLQNFSCLMNEVQLISWHSRPSKTWFQSVSPVSGPITLPRPYTPAQIIFHLPCIQYNALPSCLLRAHTVLLT